MAEILKDVFEDEKGNQHYLANNTETTFDQNGTPLNNGGDLSEASVNFTVSSSRKALTAKARFKALMGDIAKWLTDLGPAAFYKVADDFTTTAENYLFTARKGKQLKDEVDNLNQNLNALNDSGAIKGMDAREDGVYITYSTGADTVTKKLGNLGNTSYIQAEPTYRRVAAEFDVSDCNKILFTCRTSGSAIWFMGSNESTYVINTGTSLGFCTSSANETKEYDVSSYKYFRVEMLGSGIVQNIKFS